jgi:hypothetical protein
MQYYQHEKPSHEGLHLILAQVEASTRKSAPHSRASGDEIAGSCGQWLYASTKIQLGDHTSFSPVLVKEFK